MYFFFLLIYRKRKFCAEPMHGRLTFHFELRTRSGNFRFILLLFFCFSNQGKISSCNNFIVAVSEKEYVVGVSEINIINGIKNLISRSHL